MSANDRALVFGADVGTQGVRVVACDGLGAVVAQAERPLRMAADALPEGWVEQPPESWWEALAAALRDATAQLGPRGGDVAALSIAATSGTIALLDADGDPLRPALMYNDGRATSEADEVNAAAPDLTARLGYRFNASFALPKLLWLLRHEPGALAAARYLAHAGDFLAGRLTGVYDVTDHTQALKTGYDLLGECWPPLIARMGLPIDRLPRVVAPGAPIGAVSARAAAATGLAPGTPVVAGMTDGCAAQVAGGAVAPGQWLSVLGTTLVIKGVTRELLHDTQGRVYCHRHPAGYWLPGGASNTGGHALARRFAGADLAALDTAAERLAPGRAVAYPLERVGERFPFLHPQARGFTLGAPDTPEEEFLACLEGVGYVERLAYDTLAALGAAPEGPIIAMGGGARSRAWLQIRADILGRPLIRPVQTGAAFGAALIAAGATLAPDLITAARRAVRYRPTIEPRGALAGAYDERYARFVAECVRRGYLPSSCSFSNRASSR